MKRGTDCKATHGSSATLSCVQDARRSGEVAEAGRSAEGGSEGVLQPRGSALQRDSGSDKSSAAGVPKLGGSTGAARGGAGSPGNH